jgi:hypothetical protein
VPSLQRELGAPEVKQAVDLFMQRVRAAAAAWYRSGVAQKRQFYPRPEIRTSKGIPGRC